MLAGGLPSRLLDLLATGSAAQAAIVSEGWLLDSIQHGKIAPEKHHQVPGVSVSRIQMDQQNIQDKRTGAHANTNLPSTSSHSPPTNSKPNPNTNTKPSSVSTTGNNNNPHNIVHSSTTTNFYLFRCASLGRPLGGNTITLRRLFSSAAMSGETLTPNP